MRFGQCGAKEPVETRAMGWVAAYRSCVAATAVEAEAPEAARQPQDRLGYDKSRDDLVLFINHSLQKRESVASNAREGNSWASWNFPERNGPSIPSIYSRGQCSLRLPGSRHGRAELQSKLGPCWGRAGSAKIGDVRVGIGNVRLF